MRADNELQGLTSKDCPLLPARLEFWTPAGNFDCPLPAAALARLVGGAQQSVTCCHETSSCLLQCPDTATRQVMGYVRIPIARPARASQHCSPVQPPEPQCHLHRVIQSLGSDRIMQRVIDFLQARQLQQCRLQTRCRRGLLSGAPNPAILRQLQHSRAIRCCYPSESPWVAEGELGDSQKACRTQCSRWAYHTSHPCAYQRPDAGADNDVLALYQPSASWLTEKSVLYDQTCHRFDISSSERVCPGRRPTETPD